MGNDPQSASPLPQTGLQVTADTQHLRFREQRMSMSR